MDQYDNVNAGSISALGINVSSFYKLGKTSDVLVNKKAGELVLIDIQYIGNQEIDVFMEKLQSPRPNSIFLSADSNVSKVICSSEPIKSSKKSSDSVERFMNSHQQDTLNYYYTDYDNILESLVSRQIYAGSVTKIKRLPVISVYKNIANMEFVQSLAEGTNNLSQDNKSNFIVYSKTISPSSAKMYVIGSVGSLEYKHSFIIDPANMSLKKVTSKKTLSDYSSNRSSEMSIDGCNFVKLIKDALVSA